LDDELRKALAAGDAAAAGRVVDLHGPAMFRVAHRLLGSRHDAEDVVAEVFASMVRGRERLAFVSDVKAYLFASLRHAAGRAIRKRRQQAATGLDAANWPARASSGGSGGLSGAGWGGEGSGDSEEAERLWAMVGRLPEEQRDVLVLKIQGELSFKEIGVIFGISANTAASRYRYALEKLQRMAERHE